MPDPILLPERRGVKTDKIHMLDYGGQLAAPLGGPTQTLMRLGTRHAVEVTLPLMRTEPDGRRWSALLRQAKLYGALMYFRQDGLKIGLPGAPVSNGSGLTGSTLPLRGLRPGYCIRMGQAGSLLHGGLHYLHFAADDTVVSGDGTVELPIFPMLRVIVGDGETFTLDRPLIQGSLSGNEVAWSRLTAPYTDLGTITITEDE